MIQLQATKSQVLLAPNTSVVTTSRSASFDFAGYDYATIRIVQSPSSGTNGGCSISLLTADSVPTQATQFATIVADLTAQNTNSHEAIYHVDLKAVKRYGKVILTPQTATNDTIITMAHLTLSKPEACPTGTSAMVSTTNDVVTLL